MLVIGAAVNELVAAHYLARAGHRVLVLADGAADDDAIEAGWVPPRIVNDLGLERRGLKIHRADPWASTPLPGGGHLELWQDMARSIESIRRVSPRDAAKWPAFCSRMARVARVLEKIYTAPPPDLMTRRPLELARLAGLALNVRRLGREGVEDFLRLVPVSAADLLDDWFESDALKAVLAGAAILHLCQGPRSGGTAFRLLHHHVGSPEGVFRPPASNIRHLLAGLAGIDVRHGTAVRQIAVREGRVAGVLLDSGEELAASLVVCGADPRRTLIDWVDPGWLDPELARAARNIRARGVVARVLLALEGSPGFSTLVVAPSLDYIERAHDDAKYGNVSRAPYLEARSAGVTADGRHRVEIDIQYAPFALRDGAWDAARRSALGDQVVAMLSRHVPALAAMVRSRSVLLPRDLEDRYGAPQGQLHHAELALDQALWMRPLPGWARYATPIHGLYLCGPGTHPGGAIAGAAGANAARVILAELRNGKVGARQNEVHR